MGALMIRNKHVFITGGGSGIGRAIALLFADEGATVTITGRRSKALEEVANERANISAFQTGFYPFSKMGTLSQTHFCQKNHHLVILNKVKQASVVLTLALFRIF